MARPNPGPSRPLARGALSAPRQGRVLLTGLAALGLWGASDSGVPPLELFPCERPAEAAVRHVQGELLTANVTCEGEGAPLRGPARLLFGQSLDPNHAGPVTLRVLPGIGPARAQSIVSERAKGPYASVADLTRVHGIGPKSVARLAPFLHVRRESTP